MVSVANDMNHEFSAANSAQNDPQRPPRNRQKVDVSTPSSKSVSSNRSTLENNKVNLLVGVVRTLTTSESSDQRELEKKRLEHGYADTSRKVETLVAVHQSDLTTCLQSFRVISGDVSKAKDRIKNVKNNLQSCKTLLQCKRDELRKLWVDSTEQKYVLELMEQIEKIKHVPYQVRDCLERKLFLKCSDILIDALSKLDNDLRDVESLGNFKTKLLSRKADLYRSVMEELNRQLYLKPSTELAVELRNARVRKEPLQKVATGSSEGPLGLPSSVKSLSGTYLRAAEFETPILNDNGCAYEDPNATDSADSNPLQYIAVLIEAVAALSSIPEAVATITVEIRK